MLSEFELIRRYFGKAARGARLDEHHASGVDLGIGDDCALLRPRSGMQLAVSTDMLGPLRFKQYEMRLAAILWAHPVGECELMPERLVVPPWMF